MAVIEYTERWNGFQFRSPTFLGPTPEKYKDCHIYDLVKWESHVPMIVLDLDTGKKRISKESCFSIGTLTYNQKEGWQFQSCELRLFTYYIDGLDDFILRFSENQLRKIKEENEEE